MNGAIFSVAELELVAPSELRERVMAGHGPAGRLKIGLARGDVRAMHHSTENVGALFQVAYQCNLLEMDIINHGALVILHGRHLIDCLVTALLPFTLAKHQDVVMVSNRANARRGWMPSDTSTRRRCVAPNRRAGGEVLGV